MYLTHAALVKWLITRLTTRTAAGQTMSVCHRRRSTELAHLDETGTAPAGQDALAVLEVLRTAHIGAVGGLDWIERNVANPDDRPAFIAARPDIAGGVIVSDPIRFAPAIAHITAASPRTRTPVTVTTAAACAIPPHDSEDGGLRYVVVPHRATWDRAWATTTRAELDATVTSEGRAATQARAAAARHREASALCAAFISRWHVTTRPELFGTASASTQKVTSAEHQRGKLVTDRDRYRYRQTASTARTRATEARRDAHRADQNAAAATQLVQVTSDAATAAATTGSRNSPIRCTATARGGHRRAQSCHSPDHSQSADSRTGPRRPQHVAAGTRCTRCRGGRCGPRRKPGRRRGGLGRTSGRTHGGRAGAGRSRILQPCTAQAERGDRTPFPLRGADSRPRL